MNSALILLSGGLDSYISLDIASKNYNVKLGLIFNYGQKAFKEEYEAAGNISNLYNVKLELIELPFLANLTNNALISGNDNNFNDFESVWIPNRNGLFLNIAACWCDKLNIENIIIGANKEEAEKFPDNSIDFINNADRFFEFSTIKKPKVLAPCLKFDKIDIINYAIDNKLSFDLLKSCYQNKDSTGKKHCGECMSCKYLKNAILSSKNPELVKEVF